MPTLYHMNIYNASERGNIIIPLVFYKILQKLTKVEIQQDTGDFRLLDRRCVNALKKLRESQRCAKSMFSWIGYNKNNLKKKG